MSSPTITRFALPATPPQFLPLYFPSHFACANKRRFRSDARIKAMNHLRRVDFIFEQVYEQDLGILTPLPGCSGYFAKTPVFGASV